MAPFYARRSLAAAAAVTVGLSLPAHAQNEDVSGEITLMAYAGLFQDIYTREVVEPFKEAFPNVEVKYYTTGNSANMLGALRAQRSDPQTDVVIFDASTALVGNKEGLLAPISEEEVPNLADLVGEAIIEEGFGPAVTLDNLVIVYDSETLDDPTSLSVLWDEEHAGKIGLAAVPNIQGIALTCMTASMLGDDCRESVDGAVDKLAELAPGVQTFDPTPDGYTLVMNDSLDIATGWNARAQYYSLESDGKLGVMLPEEGSVLQKNVINLVEGSDNKEAALAYINYALSPEAQAAFTEAMYYAPVNSKADVSDEARARTAMESLDKMLPIDWGWVATIRDDWNQKWRRQIISAN